MEGLHKKWGVGGRVAKIGLVMSYRMLLRVSELLIETDGRVCGVYCLKGEDVERSMRGSCRWKAGTVQR